MYYLFYSSRIQYIHYYKNFVFIRYTNIILIRIYFFLLIHAVQFYSECPSFSPLLPVYVKVEKVFLRCVRGRKGQGGQKKYLTSVRSCCGVLIFV